MSTKRFIAKHGLDNNNQTITNVADPQNSSDVATKSITDAIDTKAGLAFTQANTGVDLAQAAFDSANNVGPQIEPAFSKANSAYNKANSSITLGTTLLYLGSTNTSIEGINSLTSNTIQIGPSIEVVSNNYTTSTTDQITIDSFTATNYRTAIYEVQMTSSTNYHTITLKMIHDGTTVYLAQYGEIFTNTSLGTFDASIATGTLSLLFTPTNAVTTIKLSRQLIVV